MNIYRYLATLLVAPTLTLTQPAFAQESKPDLNQELTMYTKPGVVRIVNICYGKYKNWYDFDLSFIGTGFIIHPDGYIVTSASLLRDKEECRERLGKNIAKAFKDRDEFKNQSLSDKKIINSDLGRFNCIK